jgi:hypothetical protein
VRPHLSTPVREDNSRRATGPVNQVTMTRDDLLFRLSLIWCAVLFAGALYMIAP